MKRVVLAPKYRHKMLERFLRYVRLSTGSNDKTPEEICPSTERQFDLARILVKELYGLGIANARVDEYCYVYGTISENLPVDHAAKGKIPVLGLMAHLDTAQSQSGQDVNPQIITNYQRYDIRFPDDPVLMLKTSENPELLNCTGFTIITAGGKTLLGADDKAGIAEIMTIVEYLRRENVPHGEIRICFNPDEETGHGTDHIDLEKFAVQCAYTLDGGKEGEIEDECFNAKTAHVMIRGMDVHPGYAKDKLVNAFRVFAWIIEHLPEKRFAENSDGRQPYLFPNECPSTPKIDKFEINFLLRAFTEHELMRMETTLRFYCEEAERKFPGSKVTLEVKESYKNMKTIMDRHPVVMDLLGKACRAQGIAPIHKPIRGGTDGSALTINHGIPTPNIWAGGMNFHSRLEWIPLEWMASAAETTLKMLTLWVEKFSA
jgi:tripeptide aminopeptidase